MVELVIFTYKLNQTLVFISALWAHTTSCCINPSLLFQAHKPYFSYQLFVTLCWPRCTLIQAFWLNLIFYSNFLGSCHTWLTQAYSYISFNWTLIISFYQSCSSFFFYLILFYLLDISYQLNFSHTPFINANLLNCFQLVSLHWSFFI